MLISDKKKLLFILFFYAINFSFISVSYADSDKKKVATWNMQGANSRGELTGSENKWAANVIQLMASDSGIDILVLQEAGAPPGSAIDATGVDVVTEIIDPDTVPNTIRQLIWNRSSRNLGLFVYYMEVAQRVDVAIITRTRPDALIVIANPLGGPSARPLLGLRYGNTDYYSYHALSAGDHNEAPVMVEFVYNYYAQTQGGSNYRWMIAGDFNRESASLMSNISPTISRNLTIISQNSPTHTGGRNIDYAVIGQVGSLSMSTIGAFLFIAQLAGQYASDHTPVNFGSF